MTLSVMYNYIHRFSILITLFYWSCLTVFCFRFLVRIFRKSVPSYGEYFAPLSGEYLVRSMLIGVVFAAVFSEQQFASSLADNMKDMLIMGP